MNIRSPGCLRSYRRMKRWLIKRERARKAKTEDKLVEEVLAKRARREESNGTCPTPLRSL
jgi:hypothetical protein